MSTRNYESMSHAAIYRITVREIRARERADKERKLRELGYEAPAGLMDAALYGDSVPPSEADDEVGGS